MGNEKLGDGSTLWIKKRPYLALQNDGPNPGMVAVFVQLALEDEESELIGITDLAEMVAFFDVEAPCMLIGHEPFLQNFVPFARLLNYEYGINLSVETCGEYWVEGAEYFDIICIPKSSHLHGMIQEFALVIKYTIDCNNEHEGIRPIINGNPLAFIDDDSIPVFLIPQESSDEEQYKRNKELVVRFAFESGRCIACCNIRKALGVNDAG